MNPISYKSLVKSQWLQETLDYIVRSHDGILCKDLVFNKIVDPSVEDGSYEKITNLLLKIIEKFYPEGCSLCEECTRATDELIEELEDESPSEE